MVKFERLRVLFPIVDLEMACFSVLASYQGFLRLCSGGLLGDKGVAMLMLPFCIFWLQTYAGWKELLL